MPTVYLQKVHLFLSVALIPCLALFIESLLTGWHGISIDSTTKQSTNEYMNIFLHSVSITNTEKNLFIKMSAFCPYNKYLKHRQYLKRKFYLPHAFRSFSLRSFILLTLGLWLSTWLSKTMYFKVSETQSPPAGPTSPLLQPHNTEDTKNWTDFYTIFQTLMQSQQSVPWDQLQRQSCCRTIWEEGNSHSNHRTERTQSE